MTDGSEMLADTESDEAEVMSDDSSFHRLAPKVVNASLLTVARQNVGTIRRLVEADP